MNATDQKKEADVDLKRFSLKKLAKMTILTGEKDDENNYDKQPIAPKTETIKAKKKFDIELAPYSMVMIEYSL